MHTHACIHMHAYACIQAFDTWRDGKNPDDYHVAFTYMHMRAYRRSTRGGMARTLTTTTWPSTSGGEPICRLWSYAIATHQPFSSGRSATRLGCGTLQLAPALPPS